MRRARFIGVAGVLLALSLLPGGRPTQAQVGPPSTSLSRVLWLTDNDNLLRLDTGEPDALQIYD